MIRGYMYQDKDGLIVVCTKIDSSKYFEGVVLKSNVQSDVKGLHSKFFLKTNFTKYMENLIINNLN